MLGYARAIYDFETVVSMESENVNALSGAAESRLGASYHLERAILSSCASVCDPRQFVLTYYLCGRLCWGCVCFRMPRAPVV